MRKTIYVIVASFLGLIVGLGIGMRVGVSSQQKYMIQRLDTILQRATEDQTNDEQ